MFSRIVIVDNTMGLVSNISSIPDIYEDLAKLFARKQQEHYMQIDVVASSY